MTREEIKYEINKTLDRVPEGILDDILQYLKQIESRPDSILLTKNLKRILTEDRELLERLAK
ncbi:MAG: hypothetical protein K2U26_00845 [Cyclobacteriaceae bacterium]|nr:hypothetical protein [Cyclobacteriaceae bacterium]